MKSVSACTWRLTRRRARSIGVAHGSSQLTNRDLARLRSGFDASNPLRPPSEHELPNHVSDFGGAVEDGNGLSVHGI